QLEQPSDVNSSTTTAFRAGGAAVCVDKSSGSAAAPRRRITRRMCFTVPILAHLSSPESARQHQKLRTQTGKDSLHHERLQIERASQKNWLRLGEALRMAQVRIKDRELNFQFVLDFDGAAGNGNRLNAEVRLLQLGLSVILALEVLIHVKDQL